MILNAKVALYEQTNWGTFLHAIFAKVETFELINCCCAAIITVTEAFIINTSLQLRLIHAILYNNKVYIYIQHENTKNHK